MKEQKVESTPGAPKVVADRLAVVYDRASGNIVHFHRVTTLQGGKTRSDDEVMSAALEHASKTNSAFDRSRVNVLIVAPHAIKPGHTHRVDTKKLVLHAEPRKE
jgi:hypothetical protein